MYSIYMRVYKGVYMHVCAIVYAGHLVHACIVYEMHLFISLLIFTNKTLLIKLY